MICASLVLLQIMFAVHRFAQGATVLWAEGDGIALRAMKFYDSASQNGKPQNLASLVEMHPYRWLAPPLPPEGEVLAALYNELLKLALKKAESRLPPPSGWQRNWIRRES